MPSSSVRPTRRLWPALLLTGALGGCVIAPYGYGQGGYDPYGGGPLIEQPPPPPQYEVAPPSPGIGYVWIGGHWGFNLGRHVWIGGRWALPPAGHTWAPGGWNRHDRGWRWRDGYWRRR
ncbi:hypothetical protein [Pseudorhodoferax sp.]|uniref:hypothetical protein n=1 Tax=Pseudorhodoferax sp. TaxID=1993553 RepID=UPI002DD66A37|nr:hypothetical protein [Pseudorhodoferax sp.]